MSDDGSFISRWSRKKIEARTEPKREDPPAVVAPMEPAPAEAAPTDTAAGPLPPVEALTPESDFTPFMKSDVDPALRRQAMKTLFQDPRYNVMDGLDVYIDDYSKPDPLPEGWLEKINAVKYLGIFVKPEEEAEKAPPDGNEALQKTMPEQTLAPAVTAVPADTPEAEIPPSEVGKPAHNRN